MQFRATWRRESIKVGQESADETGLGHGLMPYWARRDDDEVQKGWGLVRLRLSESWRKFRRAHVLRKNPGHHRRRRRGFRALLRPLALRLLRRQSPVFFSEEEGRTKGVSVPCLVRGRGGGGGGGQGGRARPRLLAWAQISKDLSLLELKRGFFSLEVTWAGRDVCSAAVCSAAVSSDAHAQRATHGGHNGQTKWTQKN